MEKYLHIVMFSRTLRALHNVLYCYSTGNSQGVTPSSLALVTGLNPGRMNGPFSGYLACYLFCP